MDMVRRFEVWNIDLNPTIGHEIKKMRPCVIVSPEETNKYLQTVIVVPLTSTKRAYPTRLNCTFKGKNGQLVLDQIRAIDKSRLLQKMGILDDHTNRLLCTQLEIMFRY